MGFRISFAKRILRSVLVVFVLVMVGFADSAEKTVLAHYMPWYGSKPVRGSWGLHWTMGHFDPDELRWDGRRKVASQDYPLIGAYDSSDPDVLECQVLQMKFSGIDGVIIDWYGTDAVNDYGPIHENTKALISVIEKVGLKFAICYEDQVVEAISKKKGSGEKEEIHTASGHLRWLEENCFSSPSYQTVDGRPLFLVFGPRYLEGERWKQTLSGRGSNPVVHVLPHLQDKVEAEASFAWPPVTGGKSVSSDAWKAELKRIYETNGKAGPVIPVAFPGFHDIYEQAGRHESYGFISDRDGLTFSESLDLAWEQESDLIQIATWNDYGEGTGIEPSWKLGYRYLEELQSRTGSPFTAMDLRLPTELYHLRKTLSEVDSVQKKLDQASALLFESKCSEAAAILAEVRAIRDDAPARFLSDSNGGDSDYRLATNLLYRVGEVTEEMRTRCRLDVYHPAQGRNLPAVIWFHGGGIAKGNRSIPVPLRNQGVVVVAANYRLSPEVKSPAYIEDAAAAVAWVFKKIEKYGGSSDRIFVSGHSAGGYLASMVGLDRQYLKPHGIDADQIAGLIPFSGHTITHFTVRKEKGISGMQPVVDDLAPLFFVRKDAPSMLLITGDREMELMGRYEENAYFWRMMKTVGHSGVELRELEGFGHGEMPEPAFPLLLKFMQQQVAD